jgi:tRNA threonylcarbamoyladenosine biosynthesis protein TsaB
MPDSPPPDPRLAPQPARPGRWLALETAGLYGSIAVGEASPDGVALIAAAPLPRDARSAQTLAPAVRATLERGGWEPATITTVAVSVGPGSFTGLRVGVVTAKTLAYALGAAVIGVDTLDALADAAPAPDGAGDLWAVLDAQRGELFTARYERDGDRWERTGENRRLARTALLEIASEDDLIVGPLAETIAAGAGLKTLAAEPGADAVLRVAWRAWRAGAADNAFALAPRYHRASAAEEKLAQGEA